MLSYCDKPQPAPDVMSLPVGRLTKYLRHTAPAVLHSVTANSSCCAARVGPCGQRWSGVVMKKLGVPRSVRGWAIQAAYEPELSAMPAMNGVIWCQLFAE